MQRSAAEVVWSVVERLTSTTSRALHAFDAPSRGEAELHRLLGNVPGIVFRCASDAARSMEFVSAGSRELSGFEPRDLLPGGMISWGALIHPQDRQRVQDEVRGAVVSGRPYRVSYRIRRVDGRERMVQEYGQPIARDAGGVALEGFIAEVPPGRSVPDTEHHAGLYRTLVEGSNVGVYVVQDGRFIYVNPRFAEVFDYEPEELLALPSVGAIVQPEDRGLVLDRLRVLLEGGAEELPFEFRGRGKTGAERTVEARARRIGDARAPVVAGTVLDVTDRRRGDRRAHDAKATEALSRQASAMAHDLNNLLATVKGTAQLLLAERPSDDALAKDVADIVSAVDRGTSLARQLRGLGCSGEHANVVVALGTTLTELTPVLRRVLGPGVELRLGVEPGLPRAMIAPERLEEIVVTLALNAREAMPSGGTVTISARSGATNGAGTHAGGSFVVLEVADTGVGIPNAVQARIFEPGFSTKGQRGDGLAHVWRIVSSAGGSAVVESLPGQGAVFRVVLPAAHAH